MRVRDHWNADAGPRILIDSGISEILPNKYRGIGLAWTEFNLATWAIPGTLLATLMISNATCEPLPIVLVG